MPVCQWHLDLKDGAQGDAIKVIRAWGKEKFAASDFRKVTGARLMVGHAGASPSRVVNEYGFASLADFEAALKGMGADTSAGTPTRRRLSWRPAPSTGRPSRFWTSKQRSFPGPRPSQSAEDNRFRMR